MSHDPDIETLDTHRVYENRWMRVREDKIRRRDGTDGIYGVVEKPDFVVIAPVEDDGRIHLVEQFRYPVGARYWEFPQGTYAAASGTSPLEMARVELREETGLGASDVKHAGYLFQAYGYSTQGYDVFLASGLSQGEPCRELEEQDLVSQAFDLSTVENMIRDGEIKDAATVSAFGLLRLKNLL